jgi:hypothetical protein
MTQESQPKHAVIPQDLHGARLTNTFQILELNKKARQRAWASFDEQKLGSRLDPVDRHCVYPILRISDGNGQEGFRCYLWFKEANREARTLVLMDISGADLRSLPLISESNLHQLVGMLLGELPLVLLSETEEPPTG